MSAITRRRAALAVAAITLLGGATLPATADDECVSEHLLQCGADNDATSALPVSVTSISTVLYPRGDNEGLAWQLYRALVPAKYSMPGSAQVAVQLTQYDLGRCRTVPAQPDVPCSTTGQPGTTRWVEGSIALRVAERGQEGWYPISLGTSSAGELSEARAAGLPAYTAAGTVSPKTGGFTGSTSVGARKSIALDFVKASGVDLPPAARDLAFYRGNTYGVTSIFTGTTRWRTARSLRPVAPVLDVAPGTALPDNKGITSPYGIQVGYVTLALDPDLNTLDSASPSPLPDLPLPSGRTLADLVHVNQDGLPAIVRTDEGLLVTQRENLDDGQAGKAPAAPAAAVLFSSIPAQQAFATTLVTTTAGSQATFANPDPAPHTVTSVLNGPDGLPLFEGVSDGAGTAGVPVVAVKGVEQLKPGTYAFVCALHQSNMRGNLVVS